MSNYDPVTVFSVSADSNGGSNGIVPQTTNATGVLIHKVVLRNATNSSNVISVTMNDHPNIGSSATVIALSTNESGAVGTWERYTSETFNPPVPFSRGVSLGLTGTNASVFVYYTRR